MFQRLVVLLLGSSLVTSTALAERRTGDAAEATRRLQSVLDLVRARLAIPHPVTVMVVPANPFIVSVEAPTSRDGAFVVRLEERLNDLLSADELEAALAHELGHVWVFTHHPYLQTEQLANEVAMRAVSRDALARVYQKLWKAGGTKGDLATFLGAEHAAPGGGLRQ